MGQNNTKTVDYYYFYDESKNKTGEIKADKVYRIVAKFQYCDKYKHVFSYISGYKIQTIKDKKWILIPAHTYKRITVKENISPSEKDLRDRLIKYETQEKKLLERIEGLERELKKQLPPPYKKPFLKGK